MTFESGNHLAAGRFVTRLKAAAETAQREATPLLATVAPAAADPVPPARPRAPVLLTARVRAGRELRQKLQEAARQYTSHAKGSTAKADQAMAELEATAPTSDEGKRKIQQLGKELVRGLRDTAFSYGGYAVTKEVIARFLELPEVRLLLPAEMQKKQQAAADHETQQVLIDTAKHFIATVYKARGQRSDTDRNAFGAGLAMLLPASLFKDRRGRAAARILGLSYRQAKMGSTLNKETLDWGKGWRWITTAQHEDNAGGPTKAALNEFFHSDTEGASAPDNFNKEKVCS